MNAKTLYALIVAAVIALAAAIWVNNANRPESEGSLQSRLLLPALRDQLNDVDSITLTGAGDKVLTTLKRSADGWHVVEKSNYPADLTKLREFLLKLADATVIEDKTANPKLYAQLGVDDVSGKDAKGVQVTIGGLKQPLKLIIGLYNGAGGGGTFVRGDGEKKSRLASGNLLAEKSPADWIKHDLVDIDARRIKEVVLTSPQGKVLHIAKAQSTDANFKIADVPKGRDVASDYVANSLGSGLANLRIDDVAAAHDLALPDKVYKAHYLAFGGTVVDVDAWEAAGKNVMQVVASNDAQQLDADVAAEQSAAKAAYETAVAAAKLKVVEAKGSDAAIAKAEADVAKPPSMVDPAKDRVQRLAAATKVVEDLNKTLAGWTFIVPAYEFANFNKSIDDMLKPIAQKTAAGGRTPALQPAGQTSRGRAVKPAPAPAAGH